MLTVCDKHRNSSGLKDQVTSLGDVFIIVEGISYCRLASCIGICFQFCHSLLFL